jgi:ABC-type branched-subunit amino acid transport system ATPase component
MPISSADGSRPPHHLEVRDLAAGYGGSRIISGVSLGVGRNEVAAIVGPNGAGKSTLIKALVGVIPPIEGSVLHDGEDVTSLRTDELARRGIAYVPQARNVFPTLSVEENLKMGGYLLPKREVAARIEEVVATFPILAGLIRRHVHKLSGGEQKLVAVARVMMMRPSVYVLDEPTSGLSDKLSKQLLEEHVVRIKNSGAAIFLVEQKAMAALECSNWGYLLVSGVVHMSAAPGDMLGSEIAEMFLGRVAEDASRGATGPDPVPQAAIRAGPEISNM